AADPHGKPMITILRATRTASLTTSARADGGTCSSTSESTSASKLRSRKGKLCPSQRTASIFFTGRAANSMSHPTNGDFQYSPIPEAPEPTSSSVSSRESKERRVRTMGKNRTAWLSTAEHPSRYADGRQHTFEHFPIVIIKKLTDEDGHAVTKSEG